jgi:A/G-specific adenine glycosylase
VRPPAEQAVADTLNQPGAPLDPDRILDFYRRRARDLPWRSPDATPWAVLVSEVMLQQTPVGRVLPVYRHWRARWPGPADLAAEPAGEAIRAWGRLGYPRRALRLHGAAVAITERHGGDVPTEHAQLLALPGIGEYTAAAVASFAYGQREQSGSVAVQTSAPSSITATENLAAVGGSAGR